MQIKTNSILDRLCDIVFIVYITLLYLFGLDETNVIYVHLLFGIYTIVVVLKIITKRAYDGGIYLFAGVAFVVFCSVSLLWAQETVEAGVRVKTLWQLLFLYVIVYHDFKTRTDGEFLFKSLFLAGIALTLYTLNKYGFTELISQMKAGERAAAEGSNLNVVGMKLATTVIVGLYYIIFRRKFWVIPVTILPFILSTATASKKVILMYVIAVLLLAYLKGGSNTVTRFIKLGIVAFFLIILIRYLATLEIFSAITERFEEFANVFVDNGKVDHSTLERQTMMENAWVMFKESPIIGKGIGNFAYYNFTEFSGKKVYAHNNYLELLVGVGILGTALYYLMHSYIISNLIKILKNSDKKSSDIISATMLLNIFFTLLITDFAAVVYFDKTTWIYLAVGFSFLSSSRKQLIQKRWYKTKVK